MRSHDIDDAAATDGAPPADATSDRGSILPIVLVVSVVLATVVLAVASYTISTLRYGTVVEARADRLAAAEAAMRDALERLRVVDELCTTSAGAGQAINPNFPPINGVDVSVNCSTVGGDVPPVDGWAIVITGQNQAGGARSGDTFDTAGGGNPQLEGPVFVHNPSQVDFKDTTIKSGSLWHTGVESCTGAPLGAAALAFADSPATIGGLSFDPNDRKVFCVNRTWAQLFDVRPPTGHVSSIPAPAASPDTTTYPGCTVFSPGRYSGGIALGSDNYFRSGDYLFENVDFSTGGNTAVTFGTLDAAKDPVYPLIELSSSCQVARQDDAATGATLYLAGTSQVVIGSNSHVEVSGRQQGDFVVAVHALDSSTAEPLWSVGSGNNKESALSGMTWAPRSRIVVGTVAGTKDAAFRGGIVAGAFEGTISNAPGTGFLIKVPTSQASARLRLESVATDGEGTTVIRVVADYRPSNGDLAVRSWRVCATAICD